MAARKRSKEMFFHPKLVDWIHVGEQKRDHHRFGARGIKRIREPVEFRFRQFGDDVSVPRQPLVHLEAEPPGDEGLGLHLL